MWIYNGKLHRWHFKLVWLLIVFNWLSSTSLILLAFLFGLQKWTNAFGREFIRAPVTAKLVLHWMCVNYCDIAKVLLCSIDLLWYSPPSTAVARPLASPVMTLDCNWSKSKICWLGNFIILSNRLKYGFRCFAWDAREKRGSGAIIGLDASGLA